MFSLFFVLGLAAASQGSGLKVYEPLINVAASYLPGAGGLNAPAAPGGYYSPLQLAQQQYRPAAASLSEVYDGPVLVLYPSALPSSAANSTNLTAYVAPAGLVSLRDSPHTQRVHQEMKQRQGNLSAVMFRPSALRHTGELLRVGGRPVTKLVSPPGLKLAALARLAAGDLPFLLVASKAEFGAADRLQQLRTVGEVRFAADDSVQVECAFYSPC